ncbi:hypothetical protein I546_3275 [Mycobacterium kansasii 732]|nr:hypothetical protein I546_3275 [Mycobacterium kansasii 732]
MISGGNHANSGIIPTPNQPAAPTAPTTDRARTLTNPRADRKPTHSEKLQIRRVIHKYWIRAGPPAGKISELSRRGQAAMPVSCQ